MAKWLRKDLAASEAGWLIAFFHHSPYSKGSHDSDREQNLVEVRRYLMPILEGAGVDVVLSGHSHIYERSKLMNGAYATPTVAEGVILDAGDGDPAGDGAYRKPAGLHPHAGTVQVVTGHGGQLMHRMGTMPVMHTAIEEYGCFCVEIDGDTLSGFMLNHEGVVRDRFSIVKDR
jgi:3',5'-cyclic AMP phosphodiesterase CpdA